jgi:hypothetical protein
METASGSRRSPWQTSVRRSERKEGGRQLLNLSELCVVCRAGQISCTMQSPMIMASLCILWGGVLVSLSHLSPKAFTALFEMTCMHAILWSYPIYNIYKLVDDHNRTPRE